MTRQWTDGRWSCLQSNPWFGGRPSLTTPLCGASGPRPGDPELVIVFCYGAPDELDSIQFFVLDGSDSPPEGSFLLHDWSTMPLVMAVTVVCNMHQVMVPSLETIMELGGLGTYTTSISASPVCLLCVEGK